MTSRGIHMGEGISWPILCLINGWAAWHAGATKESYAICGDDLIGFWSRKTADRYETNLEAAGLVINKSKSFFSPRGVFCERIVEVCPDGSARSTQRLTMAEAGGQKHGWGSGENWQQVLQALEGKVLHWRQTNDKDPLHNLTQDTIARIRPHKSASGPTSIGGSGSGQARPELIVGFLQRNGRLPKSGPSCKAEDRATFATLHEMKQPLCPKGGLDYEEVKKDIQIHQGVRDLLGGQRRDNRPAQYKQWRQTSQRMCGSGRKALKSQDLIQIINTSAYLTTRIKRNATWRLRFCVGKTPHRKLNWLARMLKPRKEYIEGIERECLLGSFRTCVRESIEETVSSDFQLRVGCGTLTQVNT